MVIKSIDYVIYFILPFGGGSSGGSGGSGSRGGRAADASTDTASGSSVATARDSSSACPR